MRSGARLGPVGGGPLTFRLDGEPYTLDVPADGLLVCGWAATGNWYAVVPGCLSEDSQDRFEALLDDPWGPVGLRTCWRLVHGLAKAIYGYEWWVAQRLAATAEEHWATFAAWSVTVGFDPEQHPAHRVCAGVMAWLSSTCKEEKDARKLETQLFAPPKVAPAKGRRALPGFTPEEQAAQWQKAFAELGGG